MPDEEKVTEYGVRFPNGQEVWTDASSKSVDILTPQARQKWVRDRELELIRLGVADDPGVKFLTRERVITRTPARELVD